MQFTAINPCLGFDVLASSRRTGVAWNVTAPAVMFMRNSHLGSPQATATQFIYLDDVMGLWNSIKDRCVAEWGPQQMPYGMLEFAIKDLNGYSFGQPDK